MRGKRAQVKGNCDPPAPECSFHAAAHANADQDGSLWPSKHRLCLTRTQSSPTDLLRATGARQILCTLHAECSRPNLALLLRRCAYGQRDLISPSFCAVSGTTLECAIVSSPTQQTTALLHPYRSSTLSSPALTPTVPPYSCVQALKHGCANRDLAGLRHGRGHDLVNIVGLRPKPVILARRGIVERCPLQCLALFSQPQVQPQVQPRARQQRSQ